MNPEKDDFRATQTKIWAVVRAIPSGQVRSYGAVGALADPPISGYICGRAMSVVADDVPWWRVVGKDGNLPIRKRHPEFEQKQRELLEAEGVEFDEENRVKREFFAE